MVGDREEKSAVVEEDNVLDLDEVGLGEEAGSALEQLAAYVLQQEWKAKSRPEVKPDTEIEPGSGTPAPPFTTAQMFRDARPGDRLAVGKSQVEFAESADGSVRPHKITFENGSSLTVVYTPDGKVGELVLKDKDGNVQEKYSSSDGGKTYTVERADGTTSTITATISDDGAGNFKITQKVGAGESNKILNCDGSVVSEQVKPTGLVEQTQINLDGSSIKRTIRPDKTVLETSFRPGSPPVASESRLIDADGKLRQHVTFDEQGKPRKIELYQGPDTRTPSAVIEPADAPGLWKQATPNGEQVKIETGKIEVGADGKIKFTPDTSIPPVVQDAPPPQGQPADTTSPQEEEEQYFETALEEEEEQGGDRGAPSGRVEREQIGQADVEYDTAAGDKQPKSIRYSAASRIDFKREGGVLKEVKITVGGQESVWESTDGRTFNLKGKPDVTATISYADGKVTIDAKVNGKDERTEFHPDGSRLHRRTDASNNVWTRTERTSGDIREEINMADRRKIVRDYDRNGAKQVTIFGADGKPQFAFSRVPGSQDWQRFDLTKTPYQVTVGRLTLDENSPEPRFTTRDATDQTDRPDEGEQRRRNIQELQNTLIGAFPATIEGQLAQIQRDSERKFQEEFAKLGLPENPAVWTQDHRKQIEDLRKRVHDEMQLKLDEARNTVKARLEEVEAERRRGEYGPATKKMYQEYVNWLQTVGVPSYQRMQAHMMTMIPPDCPRKLPVLAIPGMPGISQDYMDPSTFRAQGGQDGLPPVNLGIDTSKDTPPSFEDLKKLGIAMLWMKESRDAIDEARRYLEVNTLFPDSIRQNGLPEGWHIRNYPGMDQDAYRAAFRRSSDLALRTRNLIVTAIDADKLNLAHSQNWFARSEEEIRRDLEIPPEWKIQIDPRTKKVVKIDLDLPERLDPNDPVVKQKLERLERWLAGPGKRLEKAIEDAMAKQNDPTKFLYWGTTELPKGAKFKGADGKEYDCNVLQCDFSVTKNPEGKIVVRYTIQPQNAHIASYQNLPAFCFNAGPAYVEERTYDPEDFVMVRHGMDGVQMVKAKDLAGWKSWEQTKYYSEKGLVAAMDIGMVATGLVELRAAGAAARVATGEAISMGGRQLALSRAGAIYRMGLGATGIFNNAGMRQWAPGGYNVGQWFLDARGLAFVADVTLGMPAQLRTLAGRGSGLVEGSRAWKMEEATKTLHAFWRGTDAVNKWQMTIANFGFAPMIFSDIRHQIARPDIQDSLDSLRVADRIVNGNERPSNPADAVQKRLQSYADHLDLPPAQQLETAKIIADTHALLKQPVSPTRDRAVAEAREKLAQQIKTSQDKGVQMVAAAALLALSTDEHGKLPAGDVLVSKDGQPLLSKAELETLLTDDAARLGGRALLAAELRVQLGTLPPPEYGRMLKDILDNQTIPAADKSKQWASKRTEFVERSLAASYSGATPQMELEMAKKVLESYEQQLGRNADPTTKAKLKEILDETKRLLELREKDPAAYEREVGEFKKKLMEYFRSNNGQAIADQERDASNRAGSRATLTDGAFRNADVQAGGPGGVNKQLQVAAAAALLLLNRDRNGNLNPDAVAGTREIDIPGYEYNHAITVDTPEGPVPSTEKRTVDPRKMEQTILIKDLVSVLQADATARSSGSRRVVSADILFNANAPLQGQDANMNPQVYAAILKDTLQPPPGMPQPTPEDRQWALERLGFLANHQRAMEAHWDRTLEPQARADARGRCFGVLAEDLEKTIKAVANNPNETPANRARAAFILRALGEKPDDCQRMLQDHIAESRKHADYAKFAIDEIKKDLTHVNPENRYKAAMALWECGQITKAEFNAVMMHCVDSAVPKLRADAVKNLKIDGAGDLTPEQRQKLLNVLGQPANEMNEPAQLAILSRISQIATDADLRTVTDNITGFINKDSRRYAENSTDMRAAAVTALGQLNYTGTAATVQKALDDPSGKVRIAALEALVRMNPDGLAKILDDHRAKENDPAVRAKLDDLRFSVPRETDVAAYKRQWERMIADMPRVWFERGTSATDASVRSYLERKFGKEKDPITGEEKVVLLNLKNLADNTWSDHCNAFYVGAAGRAASRFGRGMGYLLSFGQADIDTNPYGADANRRHHASWAAKGRQQIADIITEANGETPDQAIAVLAYLARNNGDPLCASARAYAQEQASAELIKLAKAGGRRADLALRELITSLKDQDININVRQRYLEAIKELCTGDRPVLSKEQAAHIIFQGMQAELERTKSKEPPQAERAASVKFWNDCLKLIEDLNPRGYLGPHYEGGATPILQFMAYNHPFPEVRERAKALVAKLQDGTLVTFDATPPERGLTPATAAARLTAVLADVNKNPEKVVEEIARTCKEPKITSADDPRIRLLQQALTGQSEKVKIAAAKVLLDSGNTAVPPEARVAAVRALAQAQASGVYHSKPGYSNDARAVANAYFDRTSDREAGQAFEQAYRQEMDRLMSLSPRQPGQNQARKIDGSVLTYNARGQIEQVQYPQMDMKVAAINLRWDDKSNLQSIQHPDGKTWTRVYKDGQPTDEWKCDGATVFNGQITVKPDGTIIMEKTRTLVTIDQARQEARGRSYVASRETIFTNGTRSTVEFNPEGKATKLVLPSGKVVEYRYDAAGNLTGYGGSHYGTDYTVRGGAEVSGNPPRHYTTEVNADGSLSYTNNEGIKHTLMPDGQVVRSYAGPPKHIQDAATQMTALSGKGTAGDQIATRLREIMTASGPIKDQADPRIPVLRQALLSPDPSVARAAQELLGHRDNIRVEAPAANWNLTDAARPFADRMMMASRILTDRSWGDSDAAKRTAAVDFLRASTNDTRLSEAQRLEAITFLLREPALQGEGDRNTRKAALEGLVRLATTGTHTQAQALELLKSLPPDKRADALEFLGDAAKRATTNEAARMEAIKIVLAEAIGTSDAHRNARKAAVEGLVALATSGTSQRDAAMTVLKNLPPGDKAEAIPRLVAATDSQLKAGTAIAAADFETRLSLVVDHYNLDKSNKASEALLWQMAASANEKNIDSAKLKEAVAMLDRFPSGASFTPITEAGDPRLAQMKRALTSPNEQLRISAALALIDKASTAVDEPTRRAAFEQVLYPKVEQMIRQADETSKGTDKAAKVKAWSDLEKLYERIGADKNGLPYTYASMRRIEAEHGPNHADLLPLYERLAQHFAAGNDPMQAEEYRRRATELRAKVADTPEVRDLRTRLEQVKQQLEQTTDPQTIARHIQDLEQIAAGFQSRLGKASKDTGAAYSSLGDAYMKAGQKDKGEAAYKQAAESLEQAKAPEAANVLAVLAKHYATENRAADFQATKERILQVSRWRGTREEKIKTVEQLMGLADYLTSSSSTAQMVGQAEDLLKEAVKLSKDTNGEGSAEHLQALETMAAFYLNPQVGRGADATQALTQVVDLRRAANGGMLPAEAGPAVLKLAELKRGSGHHNTAVDTYEELLRNPAMPPEVVRQARDDYANMLEHYGYLGEAQMVRNGGLPPMLPNIPGPDAQGDQRYRGGGPGPLAGGPG